MTNPIIEVKDLSKAYRLGNLGAKSFSDDLRNLWLRLTNRKANIDPRVLEQLKKTEGSQQISPENKNEFWALRKLNFVIHPGEVVGIIGHNGAGKSTLLKIISRITEPTNGEIILRGRLSSLLEVGTGFHPDLTGRENIYLNGAILGMTRKEIDSKFDDIVDFAKVEDFVNTPVKRYSSGMYVRLAFSVAAHLEPEILIVDEVLAVGDAEFQRRCLDKMREVAQSGRSILFVSHNMQSIRNLCSECLVLKDGGILFRGKTHEAINHYLTDNSVEAMEGEVSFPKAAERYGTGEVLIEKIRIINSDGSTTSKICFRESFSIEIYAQVISNLPQCVIFLSITDSNDSFAALSYTCDTHPEFNAERGMIKFVFNCKGTLLPGDYYVVPCVSNMQRAIDQIQRAIKFKVIRAAVVGEKSFPLPEVRGHTLIEGEWEVSAC